MSQYLQRKNPLLVALPKDGVEQLSSVCLCLMEGHISDVDTVLTGFFLISRLCSRSTARFFLLLQHIEKLKTPGGYG